MKHILAAIALSAGLFGAAMPALSTTHTASAMTQGEIRKVDRDAKKLTIRHQPIANLDMPAMTMVFQVRDAAVLDQVKVGDKVRFAVERKDGAIVVTAVEADK